MKSKLIFILMLHYYLPLKANNDSLKISGYYSKVQSCYYIPSKIDSGLFWANKMIDEAKTPYQKGLAQFAKGNLIILNGWSYNRTEFGFRNLAEAINIFAKINDREMLHQSLNTLAVGYTSRYNPNQMVFFKYLKYTNEALKVQSDKNYMITLPFKADLDDRKATKAEIKETIEIVKNNLKYWEKKNSIPHLMWRNQVLGDLCWHLTADLNQCEPILKKAMNYATQKKDMNFYLLIASSMTLYANQNLKFDKAKYYGEIVLKKAIELKDEAREANVRDQLFITYKNLKNDELAFFHKEKSLAISEKHYRNSESDREQLLKERNIDLEEKIKLERKINEQNLKQNILYMLILFLFVGVYYFFLNNKKLIQKNKEISEAMLKGQTIERQRVAADLHDNLGSTLSALWLSVDTIDKSKMNIEEKAIHQNLRENLEKAYNDVRLLSHNLLPEEFEKQGLTTILQGFVRKMNKNSKIKFELKISENFGRVDNKIEFELYSICLELVNNIIKHSKATEAKINLTKKTPPSGVGGQIELLISDNGIGIFKNDSDGKGMKNVKARVNSLNGVFGFNSIENQGVGIEITVTF